MRIVGPSLAHCSELSRAGQRKESYRKGIKPNFTEKFWIFVYLNKLKIFFYINVLCVQEETTSIILTSLIAMVPWHCVPQMFLNNFLNFPLCSSDNSESHPDNFRCDSFLWFAHFPPCDSSPTPGHSRLLDVAAALVTLYTPCPPKYLSWSQMSRLSVVRLCRAYFRLDQRPSRRTVVTQVQCSCLPLKCHNFPSPT